jgi:hypothetical protein
MPIPVPGAPALPRQEIYEGLCSNCLGPHNARRLRQDEQFAQLQWRARQIFDVDSWAKVTLGIDIGRRSLERAFNSARSIIRAALQNGCDEPKQRRRHLAVDAEFEADI